MAIDYNRQYVGARYVPKFFENPNGSWDWAVGFQYEPLTIVQYGTNTYTSTQMVPATVGAPNLNPMYWAQTGQYNGAILQLQQDVNKILTSESNYKKGNVLDYGAIGDGITDDTTAFANTIASNDVIIVPSGRYKISSLSIPNKIFLCYGELYCPTDGIIITNLNKAFIYIRSIIGDEDNFIGDAITLPSTNYHQSGTVIVDNIEYFNNGFYVATTQKGIQDCSFSFHYSYCNTSINITGTAGWFNQNQIWCGRMRGGIGISTQGNSEKNGNIVYGAHFEGLKKAIDFNGAVDWTFFGGRCLAVENPAAESPFMSFQGANGINMYNLMGFCDSYVGNINAPVALRFYGTVYDNPTSQTRIANKAYYGRGGRSSQWNNTGQIPYVYVNANSQSQIAFPNEPNVCLFLNGDSTGTLNIIMDDICASYNYYNNQTYNYGTAGFYIHVISPLQVNVKDMGNNILFSLSNLQASHLYYIYRMRNKWRYVDLGESTEL